MFCKTLGDLECSEACLESNTRLVLVRWHSLGEHLLFRHVLQGSFHLREKSTIHRLRVWFQPHVLHVVHLAYLNEMQDACVWIHGSAIDNASHAVRQAQGYINMHKHFALPTLNIAQSIMLKWQRRRQHQAWHKFPKISSALTQSSFKA